MNPYFVCVVATFNTLAQQLAVDHQVDLHLSDLPRNYILNGLSSTLTSGSIGMELSISAQNGSGVPFVLIKMGRSETPSKRTFIWDDVGSAAIILLHPKARALEHKVGDIRLSGQFVDLDKAAIVNMGESD